ncbi:MAG: citrate/2-methylcitrate synthase [Anaerolineae bacterium]|nr:helix-turn-helix domain-containing protein [Anaerolineae bacterium]
MKRSRYLTAKEAADLLGISATTLYAYVSRGLIRSEATTDDSRVRRYNAEDVQKLKARKDQRKNPAKAVQESLHWGAPILESGLTLITDEALYYRGQEARELALHRSVEEVAALLWTGELEQADRLFGTAAPIAEAVALLRVIEGTPGSLSLMQRVQMALTLAGERDLAAFDLNADKVALTGARILRLMATVTAGRASTSSQIVDVLCDGWRINDPAARQLISAALILCADHELNVSSFTARVVASARTQPYLVVLAGLAALQGLQHGGSTERAESLLRDCKNPQHADQLVVERLRRGERIAGFGHQLYPDGDPRAAVLLNLIAELAESSELWSIASTIIARLQESVDQKPNIDFALGVLVNALNLPYGSALALFAVGRTIGWIGHAIEQYEQGQMIRPRAKYTGVIVE